MSQTKLKAVDKHKPAKPAKAERKLKYTWTSKDIAHRVGDGLKQDLATELDCFIKNAHLEECRFLMDVLRERDFESPSIKARNDHDMPLFTAIEQLMSGYRHHILLLRHHDMLKPVEEFINSLEEASEKDEPAREPHTRTELHEIRQKELQRMVDLFLKDGSNDDVYFLVSALNRWDSYMDYEKKHRPPSPLLAAIKMEIDADRWLITIPYQKGTQANAVLEMLSQEGWLCELLTWITEKGAENLSPCLVSAKAAGMQEAYDKAHNNAA